jgi:hypothetical protein
MLEETDIQKNKELHAVFLNSLPQKIKDIILSENTPILIAGICLANNVLNTTALEKTAYYSTMLLLGKISQENFPLILERELQIDEATAKIISKDVNKLIISQASEQDPEDLFALKDIAKNKIDNEEIEKNKSTADGINTEEAEFAGKNLKNGDMDDLYKERADETEMQESLPDEEKPIIERETKLKQKNRQIRSI